MVDRFAPMHVRDMKLDLGPIEHLERVEQGHGGESQTGWIDDDPCRLVPRLVDTLDQCALEVCLAEIDLEAVCLGAFSASLSDFRQGRASVYFRLALTEQVQVRIVQDENHCARHE